MNWWLRSGPDKSKISYQPDRYAVQGFITGKAFEGDNTDDRHNVFEAAYGTSRWIIGDGLVVKKPNA